MNAQVRDNEIHIAGSLGFTAAPSTARGIEPASGYFAGATAANCHVESGHGAISTGGTAFSFANAYATTLAVTITLTSSALTQNFVGITAITTTGFTAAAYYANSSGYWIGWGQD